VSLIPFKTIKHCSFNTIQIDTIITLGSGNVLESKLTPMYIVAEFLKF